MATTRIQSGGVTALSITHDKLHTDMNLSTKTVVLPSLSQTLVNSSHLQLGGNLDVVGQIGAYDNTGSSWGKMILRATEFELKNGGGTIKMVLDTSGNLYLKGGDNITTTAGNTNLQVLTTDSQGADLGGSIGMGGVYHATNQITFAEIHGKKENNTTANLKGYMAFVTRNASGSKERMRVTSNGGLELGYAGATRQQADSQAFTIVTPANGGGQGIALKRLDSNDDQILGSVSWSNNTQDGLSKIVSKTDGAVNTTDIKLQVSNAGTLISALVLDGSEGGKAWFSGQLRTDRTGTSTNSVDPLLYLNAKSSNTTVAGFGPGIVFAGDRNGDGATQQMAQINAVAEVNSGTTLSSGLRFRTATAGVNSTKMAIMNDGKVGIGINPPTSKLEVFTADQDFEDSSNAIRITHPAGPLQGNVGGGIVFAQRWYTQSTQDVRTGGIYGIKTIGSGAYGGGLAFYTQPNSAAAMNQTMVLSHAKNVGIGTSLPEVKLEVNGGADGSVVFAGRSDGGNGNNRRFNLLAYADGGGANYGGGLKIQTRDSVNVFHDRITVRSNGRVGVGVTNTDQVKFEVSSVDTSEDNVMRIRLADDNNSNATANPFDYEYKNLEIENTYSGAAPTANGTKVAKLQFTTVTNSGYAASSSIMGLAMSGGHNSGAMVFATGPNSSGNEVERMRIDNEGRVTMPLQIGFKARGNTSQWLNLASSSGASWNRITNTIHAGNGTDIGVNLTTVTKNNFNCWNTGNDFSLGDGTFTAPVAGVYLLSFTMYGQKNNSASASDFCYALPYINGQQINEMYAGVGANETPAPGDYMINYAHTVYLEVDDYVDFRIYASSTNVQVYGDHLSCGVELLH